MNLRLRTTQDIEEKLNILQNWLHVSSKAAIMRLAISWSLKDKTIPALLNSEKKVYDSKEKNGPDYLRLTIFGQDEAYYKLLMENHFNREIADDEFFPALTSFYIESGVSALFSEYRYLNDKDKFLKKLLDL